MAGSLPMLRLDVPGPDGGPNPLLLKGPGRVVVPAGGEPLILARSWPWVRYITTSSQFRMAGADDHQVLRGHPVTGAEMQDPDCGLLNMNGRKHRDLRALIDPLLRPAATGVSIEDWAALAAAEALSLGPAKTDFTVLTARYTDALITSVLGIPRSEAAAIARFGAVAFGVAHDAETPYAAWQEEYRYWHHLAPGSPGAAGKIYRTMRLARYTQDQAVHAVANVANGFTALFPVILSCLRSVTPPITAAKVMRAIGTTAMYPVDLPRRGPAGELWLPVLVAAARNGAPPSVAFGPGQHHCPGAQLALKSATALLAAFHTLLPGLRILPPATFRPGTLAVPDSLRGMW